MLPVLTEYPRVEFIGKVAIVTGAALGIGRAIAGALAQEGNPPPRRRRWRRGCAPEGGGHWPCPRT